MVLKQLSKTRQITVPTAPDVSKIQQLPVGGSSIYIHNDNNQVAFVVVVDNLTDAQAAVAPTDVTPSWAFSLEPGAMVMILYPNATGKAYVNAWSPGGAGGEVRFTPFN